MSIIPGLTMSSLPSRPTFPATEPTYNPDRPFPEILPLYSYPVPNCHGKTMVALRVSFPPNGSTPPHTHAGAFVAVHVDSGYVLNKMNDEPMEMLGPNESFHENPGCHHVISDNASDKEPAEIVANLLVDTAVVEKNGVLGVVVIDEKYRAIAEAKMAEQAKQKGGS